MLLQYYVLAGLAVSVQTRYSNTFTLSAREPQYQSSGSTSRAIPTSQVLSLAVEISLAFSRDSQLQRPDPESRYPATFPVPDLVIFMMTMRLWNAPSTTSELPATASTLRPPCWADGHLFLWRGVSKPPPAVLDVSVIRCLGDLAACHTLRDTTSCGSGNPEIPSFLRHLPHAGKQTVSQLRPCSSTRLR